MSTPAWRPFPNEIARAEWERRMTLRIKEARLSQKRLAEKLGKQLDLAPSGLESELSKFKKARDGQHLKWLRDERVLAALAEVLGCGGPKALMDDWRAAMGEEEPEEPTWHPAFPGVDVLVAPCFEGGQTVAQVVEELKKAEEQWRTRLPPDRGEPPTVLLVGEVGSGRSTAARELRSALGQESQVRIEAREHAAGVDLTRPDSVLRLAPWGPKELAALVQDLVPHLDPDGADRAQAWLERVERDAAWMGPRRKPVQVIQLLADIIARGLPASPHELRARLLHAEWERAGNRAPSLAGLDEAWISAFWAQRVVQAGPSGAWRMDRGAAVDTVQAILDRRREAVHDPEEALEALARAEAATSEADRADALAAARAWLQRGPAEHRVQALVDSGLLREVDGALAAADVDLARVWAARGLGPGLELDLAGQPELWLDPELGSLLEERLHDGWSGEALERLLAGPPGWAAVVRTRLLVRCAAQGAELTPKTLVAAWAGGMVLELVGANDLRREEDLLAHLVRLSELGRDHLPRLDGVPVWHTLWEHVDEPVRRLVAAQRPLHVGVAHRGELPESADALQVWSLRDLIAPRLEERVTSLAPWQCVPESLEERRRRRDRAGESIVAYWAARGDSRCRRWLAGIGGEGEASIFGDGKAIALWRGLPWRLRLAEVAHWTKPDWRWRVLVELAGEVWSATFDQPLECVPDGGEDLLAAAEEQVPRELLLEALPRLLRLEELLPRADAFQSRTEGGVRVKARGRFALHLARLMGAVDALQVAAEGYERIGAEGRLAVSQGELVLRLGRVAVRLQTPAWRDQDPWERRRAASRSLGRDLDHLWQLSLFAAQALAHHGRPEVLLRWLEAGVLWPDDGPFACSVPRALGLLSIRGSGLVDLGPMFEAVPPDPAALAALVPDRRGVHDHPLTLDARGLGQLSRQVKALLPLGLTRQWSQLVDVLAALCQDSDSAEVPESLAQALACYPCGPDPEELDGQWSSGEWNPLALPARHRIAAADALLSLGSDAPLQWWLHSEAPQPRDGLEDGLWHYLAQLLKEFADLLDRTWRLDEDSDRRDALLAAAGDLAGRTGSLRPWALAAAQREVQARDSLPTWLHRPPAALVRQWWSQDPADERRLWHLDHAEGGTVELIDFLRRWLLEDPAPLERPPEWCVDAEPRAGLDALLSKLVERQADLGPALLPGLTRLWRDHVIMLPLAHSGLTEGRTRPCLPAGGRRGEDWLHDLIDLMCRVDLASVLAESFRRPPEALPHDPVPARHPLVLTRAQVVQSLVVDAWASVADEAEFRAEWEAQGPWAWKARKRLPHASLEAQSGLEMLRQVLEDEESIGNMLSPGDLLSGRGGLGELAAWAAEESPEETLALLEGLASRVTPAEGVQLARQVDESCRAPGTESLRRWALQVLLDSVPVA